MKRIILSLVTLGIVGVIVTGATAAIFTDTEVSTGNTFTAGAIDLQIDNESYYNGVANEGTSWLQKDLVEGVDFFFNFDDLKPGDWGEDTISIHVNNNDSYVCADVTLTSNDDNGSTEPEENDENPYTDGPGNGELADGVTFIWWADDGDNVLEDDETVINTGTLGDLGLNNTVTAPLADSQVNIWGEDGPLPGDSVRYLGKAWCFGDLTLAPVAQDGETDGSVNNPTINGGFNCDGAPVNNETQTDSMTADISFRAVQSRNNGDFLCIPPAPRETAEITVTKVVDEDGPLEIADFGLLVGATGVTSGAPTLFAAPEDYAISEVDDSGLYTSAFTGGDCDVTTGIISVVADGTYTCEITNTYAPATLNVDKRLDVTTVGIDASDFELHIVGPNGDQIVTDNTPTTDLPAGDYSVYEVLIGDAVGVTFDSTFGGACNLLGEVTLVQGDDLECTLLNVEIDSV